MGGCLARSLAKYQHGKTNILYFIHWGTQNLLQIWLFKFSEKEGQTVSSIQKFFAETGPATQCNCDIILNVFMKLGLFLCIASTTVFTSVWQDWFSPFSLQPLKHVAHSHSPWQASSSNPGPQFHECMQNDVTIALWSWTSFHKKTFCILLRHRRKDRQRGWNR